MRRVSEVAWCRLLLLLHAVRNSATDADVKAISNRVNLFIRIMDHVGLQIARTADLVGRPAVYAITHDPMHAGRSRSGSPRPQRHVLIRR